MNSRQLEERVTVAASPITALDHIHWLSRLGRLVIVVLLLVLFGGFVQPAGGADGFWIMGNGLALNGQSGWNYYNAGDAPEGAYMGWMYSGTSKLQGTVPLQRNLSPGKYYIFLKVIDYMGKGKINVSIGGANGEISTSNDDWNKYWTAPLSLDVTSTSSSVDVTLIKTTAAVTETQKYMLRGIYITSNANENIQSGGYDRIVDLQYPTVMDDSPANKGNMVPNGSFEGGLGYGWGFFAEGYFRDYNFSSLWDSTVGFDGHASIRMPRNTSLISRVVRTGPNKWHTLSAWVKASSACGVFLELYGFITPPPGYPDVTKLSKTFYIGTTWQRVSISGYLLDYPGNEYQVKITSGGPEGTLTWIDAVQLEEGNLSDYAPSRALEVGLVSNHVGNLFYEDESVAMDLTGYNHSDTAVSNKTVRYSIYNYLNRKVKDGTVSVSASPKSSFTQSLNLATDTRGIFRIVMSVENDDLQEEVVYSVLPRPRISGADPSSIVGISPNFATYQLQTLQKMGIKGLRVMSPSAFFRWKDVEPVEGQIRWYDAEVQKAADNGFTIMGAIGTNNYWPTWADVSGMPDLNKWESFVERLVLHYKGKVKYWEIWNEPHYVFTAAFYTDMLKKAAAAIHRSDPDAKIVGMGGVHSDTWVKEVMDTLGPGWSSYLDYVSTHLYPSNTEPNAGETGQRMSTFKKNIIDVYGVEVWNTETGAWDIGFYRGPNSDFVKYGEPAWEFLDDERYQHGSAYEAERAVSNFLHCVGNGMTKYYYYDSRIYVTPGYRSHPTIMEYDDTVRSKGIGYSIAGYFIDHSTGQGNVSASTTQYYAYVFDRGGVPVAALKSLDGRSRTITVVLPGTTLKAYDMMGNPIAVEGSTIAFGMYPVYVESQGTVSVSDFRNALQQGQVVLHDDSQAPNVSIDSVEKPIGSTSTRIRWGAIDDISIPTGANPNAILYSYQLQGVDTWSAWTPKTIAEYPNLPTSDYIFSVKAKDQAGNVSSVESIAFNGGSFRCSAPTNLRVVQ